MTGVQTCALPIFIYVDEAQDTNPVCFDVLLRQKAKMVYVGDAYQSIYAFRGAVNAMEKIVAPTYTLSKSFRYGEKIAIAASEILRDVTVKGLETINSRISTLPDDVKYTMIFRTNAGLVEKAVQLFLDGKKVNCNIDVRQFENRLLSIKALREDKHEDIKDDTIALFASWNELVEAFDEHRDLKMMADIVLSGKINEYLAVLRDIGKNSTDYDVMLTTAHKSKGCEWDHVKIATDFDFETIFTTRPDKYDQQEVNLFYVAVTRAIKVLDIPAVAYAYWKRPKSEGVESVEGESCLESKADTKVDTTTYKITKDGKRIAMDEPVSFNDDPELNVLLD